MPKVKSLQILVLAAALLAGAAHAADAPSRYLAPGFTARPVASRLLVLPADMELFSISAGGITEPRADWTEAGQKNFKAALVARPELANRVEIGEKELDDFAEVVALHRAVAEAVWVHHADNGTKLPTKDGRLDWSLGAGAVAALREKTGADYALFTWVRDSYASNERKAVMIGMLLLGSVTFGGNQAAYASLVDLKTGRVVWFRDLDRMWGDLREAKPAAETVEALLKGFPEAK
ncbi:MAG: hypothetical protein HY854_24615 [Burkholderiales bacterium]|nr:hypothetical protein [Burkholderiales bacterium]